MLNNNPKLRCNVTAQCLENVMRGNAVYGAVSKTTNGPYIRMGHCVRGTLCPCIYSIQNKLWDLVSYYSVDLVSGGPYVHVTLCPKTVGPCVKLT